MTRYSKEYFEKNIHLSDQLLAYRNGVAVSAIWKARVKRGVLKPQSASREGWHELEHQYLIDNADMPNELIAFALDRSINAVHTRKIYHKIYPYGSECRYIDKLKLDEQNNNQADNL